MRTPASVARHPIHPMLIAFPVVFFTLAPILDVIAFATGDPTWERLAFLDIAAGIATALAAAVPGFIDYLSLRGSAARTATWHMTVNLIAVAMFGASLVLRGGAAQDFIGNARWVPFALAFGGTLIVMIGGWLGGHLAYVHRVGVEEAIEAAADRRRAA
jgi:uncharacterized membrane protein